ncbi:hypothetical protein L873DRAFT_1320096 [Choiromyces venosus 120613-1]|uniref:Uncharacterized protein n=1 Tax=Choiromyces venosus 120613-1 TaxID=1336337 RepID=A0A3N4JNG4_9PEZI|nr:hypothetical protein L873DRAFT_1320096 [Choiromyces venosus 120613-1]
MLRTTKECQFKPTTRPPEGTIKQTIERADKHIWYPASRCCCAQISPTRARKEKRKKKGKKTKGQLVTKLLKYRRVWLHHPTKRGTLVGRNWTWSAKNPDRAPPDSSNAALPTALALCLSASLRPCSAPDRIAPLLSEPALLIFCFFSSCVRYSSKTIPTIFSLKDPTPIMGIAQGQNHFPCEPRV